MENFVKSYDAKNIDVWKLANFLYTRRKMAEATQKEFAEYLGTTTSNYQRYEVGKVKRIPFTFVEKLVEKFGVPAETFLVIKEPYKDNIKIAQWLGTEEAKPYILEAYSKYLKDQAESLEARIKKATYGKID